MHNSYMKNLKPAVQIHNSLVKANVQYAVCLPDSLSQPLITQIHNRNQIQYIQATHESDCVGISTGLNLTNTLSVVLMENSGLRNACETIARFHLSHALYNIYIISSRGEFGERNWWGQAHATTMKPMLDLLRFRYAFVNYSEDFDELLARAIRDFEARQSSTALILNPDIFKK